MDMRMLGGIALGVVIGIISGLIGVGGGIVLVPALIYLFRMDQHTAQGTSLAMLLPPTGLLAFLRYYRDGHADLKLGMVLAAGVFVGGYFGGQWAQNISALTLRRIFAVVLVATAAKLFFQK